MLTTAQFIAKHQDELVRLWFEDASRAASSRGLDRPEFTNIMPKFIAALTGTELGAFTAERRRYIESHLAARIRQGFSVEEVVDELLLVARCVKRMSDSEPSPEEHVAPLEIARLWAELHRACAAVSDMFTKHMAEDEQGEKHFSRRLRTLAHAALAKGAVPLRARLDEALALIMEGVGAQCAALLLFRPASRELVTVASVGVDGMGSHVAGLDETSFASEVAASADATVVPDVQTTQLTIPEGLRRSGIQSLLGIRLPPHHTLAGILYVGLRESRAFSAREVRRLEALGEQLTLHLDNASLVATLEEKLEALEVERELRERFVSVLAHDLRGPLSAIKLTASVVSMALDAGEELPRARLADLARRLDRNIDRADRMVRDLLDANRIHAGKPLPLALEECDIAALARATVAELSELHPGRFVVEAPPRVLGVWAVDELRRALWNLATNAVKYGATDRQITVRVAADAEHAFLSVHNHGHAIPEAEREHLFTPFSRARSAEGSGTRGWGLGLTLVKGVAEAHGGRVSVESDAASGTTFTIELPRAARPTPAAKDARETAPAGSA